MSKKRKLVLAAGLIALIATLVLVYALFTPSADAGGKRINFSVTHGDGTVKTFAIDTDSEYLRGALEQEGLIEGEEGQYGLYVTAVDAEAAVEAQRQWWSFTKDGQLLPTGVDDTAIADGDSYEASIEVY